MPATPMLADLELSQVRFIVADGEQVFARHGPAAVDGDPATALGRRGSVVRLVGVLSDGGAAQGLRDLRERFRAAEPVAFTADIAVATRVDQVLIEELTVCEIAGHPERFEYSLVLRQYAPPPSDEAQAAAPGEAVSSVDAAVEADGRQDAARQVDRAVAEQGSLAVEVTNPSGNFAALAVLVEGASDGGAKVSLTLHEQQDGVYRYEGLPAGSYTVQVVRKAAAS